MKIPVCKNEEYVVEIIDNGFDGEGIAKINGYTLFIHGGIKGERVRVKILKALASHAFGKIVEIIEKSHNRIEADCDTYKRCGGCNLRHIQYGETLKIKQNMVQTLVNKTLKNKVTVQKTLGMEEPYYYRNKLQYPLGVNRSGEPIMGVFAKRSHEVIETKNCFIQNETAQKIAESIFEFIKNNNISIYNEATRTGLIRHIIVKIGVKTNEVMCILVINGTSFPQEKEFVEEMTSRYENIKSIVKNINTKNTNVILGDTNINLYGNGYIQDKLGDFVFNISPMSFYQVNPIQAENLYKLAIKNANINKDDVVFDLYCGIGTISLFMAKYAKKVYGVEIVEEAIEMAKENAKINNVTNAEFIAGDVQNILEDLFYNKKIIPDVVVVDPPRKGLDTISLDNIMKIKPKKIVYISCNPATLIRDLSKLEEVYEVKFIKPVDMFPFTSQIECVTVMESRKCS